MRTMNESGTRPKLPLIAAVAITFTVLIAMLLQQQQRAPSWSGRVHLNNAAASAPVSIGRFASQEECRLSGTANLQQRGWSDGRTVCTNDQRTPRPPGGDERVFKVRDGVATEVPQPKP
jgi:hypothetical protein